MKRLLTCLLFCVLASCSSAPKSTPPKPGEPRAKPPLAGEPVRGKPMDSDNGNAFGLQTILFPSKSLQIVKSQRDKLARNAEILKAHPTIYVELEGHTDGRGPMAWSLELAETRAKIIREVLIGLEIDGSRISTISYGKDRMLDRSGTEKGYQRNRRVNFLILRY